MKLKPTYGVAEAIAICATLGRNIKKEHFTMSLFRMKELGLNPMSISLVTWKKITPNIEPTPIQRHSTLPLDVWGYWNPPHFYFCLQFAPPNKGNKYYSVVIPKELLK